MNHNQKGLKFHLTRIEKTPYSESFQLNIFAHEYLNAEDFKIAQLYLNSAISHCDKYEQELLELSKKDKETSIEFYKERIKDNTKIKARAHSSLAYIESVFKIDFTKALHHAKCALDFHPDNTEIQYSYYQHLFATGFLEKAEAYLLAFRNKNPFHMASWNDYILILKERGDWNQIIQLSLELLQRTKAYPDIYLALGSAYFMEQEFEKAVDIYLQGIAVHPLDSLYSGALMAYSHLGEHKKALSLGRKALDHHSKNPQLLIQVASILINLQHYQEALSLLDQSIEINPYDPTSYYAKACAYAKLNQVEATVEIIEKTLKLDPTQIEKFRIEPDLQDIINTPKLQRILSSKK